MDIDAIEPPDHDRRQQGQEVRVLDEVIIEARARSAATSDGSGTDPAEYIRD